VSTCIEPNFLDLGTSWRWVVSFTPQPLCHQGKSPLYPLDWRLGGPQNRFEKRGEGKILDPTGARIPTLGRPARSQSLCRLRCEIWFLSVKKKHELSFFSTAVGRRFGCQRRNHSRMDNIMHWGVLYFFSVHLYYSGDQIKEDEMDRTCNIHEGDEKFVENFSYKTLM
jgi:hypothetical protein